MYLLNSVQKKKRLLHVLLNSLRGKYHSAGATKADTSMFTGQGPAVQL